TPPHLKAESTDTESSNVRPDELRSVVPIFVSIPEANWRVKKNTQSDSISRNDTACSTTNNGWRVLTFTSAKNSASGVNRGLPTNLFNAEARSAFECLPLAMNTGDSGIKSMTKGRRRSGSTPPITKRPCQTKTGSSALTVRADSADPSAIKTNVTEISWLFQRCGRTSLR